MLLLHPKAQARHSTSVHHTLAKFPGRPCMIAHIEMQVPRIFNCQRHHVVLFTREPWFVPKAFPRSLSIFPQEFVLVPPKARLANFWWTW